MNPRKNILIIGAGINGLALACALKQGGAEAGFSVTVLDKNLRSFIVPLPHVGEGVGERASLRVSALTPSSLDFLESLTIKKDSDREDQRGFSYFSGMKVWNQNNLNYSKPDLDLEARGAVVKNNLLQAVLKNQAEALGVIFYEGEPVSLTRDSQKVYVEFKNLDFRPSRTDILEADILIGADGVNSWVRAAAEIKTDIKSYQELAIVAVLETSKNHAQKAYQKFIHTGPIAFLPLLDPHEISLVWSCEKNTAQELLNLSAEDFEKKLEKNFGILGALKLKSERVSFELKHHHAKRYISDKIILIGDAAHSIHPLAGLGLNMGLKDVKVLAEILINNKNKNYSWAVLSSYERQRISQNFKINTAMTGIDFIFKLKLPCLDFIKTEGMRFINQSEFLKRMMIESGT